MKKLSKILINPEKVIKNEELLKLKGGQANTTRCEYMDPWEEIWIKPLIYGSYCQNNNEAETECKAVYGETYIENGITYNFYLGYCLA